jgi:hypothetical protein
MQNPVTITKKCQITGEVYSVTAESEDLERYKNGEGLIQNIFPYLNAGDREFIKTGISPKGWDNLFAIEEED